VALVEPSEPLPLWAREYLAGAASSLCKLSPPTAAPGKVAGALGLTARGRNRFAEYRHDQDAKLFTTAYFWNTNQPNVQVKTATADLAKWGRRDRAQVYRWINHALKLWGRH
jgi:hypothetical protein